MSAPDLSKLRINRDIPAPLRLAFRRNLILAAAALGAGAPEVAVAEK